MLDTTLYFITDSTGYERDEFLRRVDEALQGGVTIIQLREKNRTTREYIELAAAVHDITKKYNVPLIIDDRVDVMLAVDAEGVHVGAEDMPVATARRHSRLQHCHQHTGLLLSEERRCQPTRTLLAAQRHQRRERSHPREQLAALASRNTNGTGIQR